MKTIEFRDWGKVVSENTTGINFAAGGWWRSYRQILEHGYCSGSELISEDEIREALVMKWKSEGKWKDGDKA